VIKFGRLHYTDENCNYVVMKEITACTQTFQAETICYL